MGGAVFPPSYLPGPNHSGSDEDNGDLLQNVLCTHCYTQCPQPCSRPPLTHASTGHSWTLTGKSGQLLLSPGPWCTRFSLCPPRVCSQSCVSSGSSLVGLMATSTKRANAIPRSAVPRAPAPVAVHCWPVPPQETLKHSFVSVSVGYLGPSVHKVCLSPLSISGRYGVWF